MILKSKWTLDMSDYRKPTFWEWVFHPFKSYRRYKNLSWIQTELMNVLTEEITAEIDREILEKIKEWAKEQENV